MRNVVPNLELPQENTTGNINYLLLIDKLICRKKRILKLNCSCILRFYQISFFKNVAFSLLGSNSYSHLLLFALIFHFLLVPMIHYFVLYFHNYCYRPLKSQIQTYIHLLFTMKKKFHKGINLLQFEFFSSRICQGIRKIIIFPMVL